VARGSGSLTSTDVRAQDGRVPGGRGLATRAKLLKTTHELLEERSYRDLATADIARQAGTSPATFYQYFSDVESAVLVLAEQMAAEHAELSVIVRAADWLKPSSAAGASDALATTFLAFWQRHRSILRVVDLASAEGDKRFRALRTTLLNDVTNALADAVRAVRAHGHQPTARTDPMAVAAVLVSMLAHVASHTEGLGNWGIAPSDTQIVMADIVHQAITGRRISRP
jgi:AcrR family transcriptional regulator